MKSRRNLALVRATAAVVLAVLLLALTGCGALRLLGDPDPVTDAAELKNGAYAGAELPYIMDIIGVEKSGSGRITGYYAVAPLGDSFVTVRFPASDAENMRALEQATDAFLQGDAMSIPYFLTVSGGVKNLSEDEEALLSQWFSDNASWMSQSGVISAVENYGDYLSGRMIDTGSVAGVSVGAAVAAGAAAALLLIYAVVELVLVGLGTYDKPRKGRRAHG